jgi:S-adenosylmethionine decarboxylase
VAEARRALSNLDASCMTVSPLPATGVTRPQSGVPGQQPLQGETDGWQDLAPDILRQRLVIEGVPARPVDDALIRSYLSALSRVVDMVQLLEPVTHRSDLYGWAGWIHWETSGAHFYAWEQPRLFFSVDVYTCKVFDVDTAVSFTQDFLSAGTVVAKSF